MGKDLSKLTPEELIRLAKNPIAKKTLKSNLSPIKDFIISEGLVAGDTQIPALTVYDRYFLWCKSLSITPFTITRFFIEFKHYFERIKTRSAVCYLLDQNGFDLSPSYQKILAEEYGKRNSSGKKRRKKEVKTEKGQ